MPENAESFVIQILSAGSIVLTLFASVLLIILSNNGDMLDRAAKLGLRLTTASLLLFAAWMLVGSSPFPWMVPIRPVLAVAASVLLPGGMLSLARSSGFIALVAGEAVDKEREGP